MLDWLLRTNEIRWKMQNLISGKVFFHLLAAKSDVVLLIYFQSLRLHWGNICVLLPVISWSCRHIAWVPTDVEPSLLPVRQRGTLYYRNSCVILFTPPPCLHVYWRHFFSLSTSVYSALGAVFFVVDALYKLTFYLLTYFYLYARNEWMISSHYICAM